MGSRSRAFLVHPHSLELIEFPRVTAAIAARAVSPRARTSVSGAMPIAHASKREMACERLAEAIRRQREPEAWCFAAASALSDVLSTEVNEPFEPADFAVVADWLDAGERGVRRALPAAREAGPLAAGAGDAPAADLLHARCGWAREGQRVAHAGASAQVDRRGRARTAPEAREVGGGARRRRQLRDARGRPLRGAR